MKIYSVALVLIGYSMISRASEIAQPIQSDLAELIQRLGDDSFATREEAARELVRHGLTAQPALEQALEHADLEIRLRADKLLVIIAKTDLDKRLTAFINDVEGKHEHDLPGWTKFQSLIGSDRLSRTLFAEMVRAEPALLSDYESGPAKVVGSMTLRIQSFISTSVPGADRESVKPQSLATLLFIGSDENVKLETSLGYQFYNLLNQAVAQKAFTDDDRSPITRKLLTVFLQRQSNNHLLARNGLFLALRYNMNDVGLSLALNLLKQKNMSTSSIPYAILTVSKFGGKEHQELLQGLMDNKTVCHSWHNGRFKDPIRVQVRDVALVAMIHLTGQKHKDYGFDLLRKSSMMLYEVYTCGFAQEEKRKAAFAKWEKWLAAK